MQPSTILKYFFGAIDKGNFIEKIRKLSHMVEINPNKIFERAEKRNPEFRKFLQKDAQLIQKKLSKKFPYIPNQKLSIIAQTSASLCLLLFINDNLVKGSETTKKVLKSMNFDLINDVHGFIDTYILGVIRYTRETLEYFRYKIFRSADYFFRTTFIVVFFPCWAFFSICVFLLGGMI